MVSERTGAGRRLPRLGRRPSVPGRDDAHASDDRLEAVDDDYGADEAYDDEAYDDEAGTTGTAAGATGTGKPHFPRTAASILGDFWQKQKAPRPTASRGTRTARAPFTAEEISGLTEQERTLGIVAALLCGVLSLVLYLAVWRHSSVLTLRRQAGVALGAGLFFAALLGVGVVVRRRALLGFASFMAGLALYSFAGITGLPFLVFGGWLLVRVMRASKQRREEQGGAPGGGRASPRGGRSASSKGGAKSGASKSGTGRSGPARTPPASKRYTPPRRSGAGATRRR